MNSYTSTFRAFRPLLIALAWVVVVEATSEALLPADLALLESPLLHMSYRKPIRPERVNTVAKIALAERMPADIIQVGESTGLAGIQPELINPALPGGLKLLNLSTQLPAEFAGFQAVEEIGLRTHPHAGYVMAVISPLHLGVVTEGFGDDIAQYYVRFPVWKLLSSLKARAFIINLVYYHALSPRSLYTIVGNANNGALSTYLQDRVAWYQHSGGWAAISMQQPFKPHTCRLTYDSGLAFDRLLRLYATAAQHHARLILVLAPVRCTPDESTTTLERDVRRFLTSHSDIIAPMPLLTVVPHEWLGDEVHLTPEGSAQYSHILAEALSHYLPAAGARARRP